MKQQKKSWVKTLLSFAEPCKGKMILSVLCAIFSVAGGFIPFWAVYKILLLFINRTATGNDILLKPRILTTYDWVSDAVLRLVLLRPINPNRTKGTIL